MTERPRNRNSTTASRKRRLFRTPGPWPDTTQALAALERAWTVTVIATLLFLAALAVAPVWDGAIFMQGLRDALSGDPQLMLTIDEVPADAPADRETLRAPPEGCPASRWRCHRTPSVEPARPW